MKKKLTKNSVSIMVTEKEIQLLELLQKEKKAYPKKYTSKSMELFF